jgi:hypothetical protein
VRLTWGPWLAATAAAYALCHHLGSLPDGLGDAGRGTRWADWLDLLVPFLVLGPALVALLAARVGTRSWAAFALGSWLYASGHGIHLAANSVGNVAPGEPAHLWDEYVGHWLWYAGVAVVAAVLARAMAGRRATPVGWLLALAVGLTWGTNALGGEFVVPGAVLALAALAYGVRHRTDQRVLLAVGGAVALVTIATGAAVR